MQVYNMNYQDEEAQVQTSVINIQNLEIALERAVQDIGLLHANLAFVIRVKEEVEAQLKVKEKREEALIQSFQKQIQARDREIERLREERQQFSDLLLDTKQSLENCQMSVMQREDEAKRLNRIIHDQKSTLQCLQQQLLALKYSCDLSNQSITQDGFKLQQLQKENEQLRFDLQKVRAQVQRQSGKTKRLEKEVQGFKQWLGSVMGVRKVMQGCEYVLMQQISNRLGSSVKIPI